MDAEFHRRQLIHILRAAYSGELAAGLAYRGHWKSLSDSGERNRVRDIERDEWIHRRRVGQMLKALDARPSQIKEIRTWLIGRTIGLACYLIGWFWPMYFAGRLESGNVEEYLSAARYARALGLFDVERDLLHMAKVERQHEEFFFSVVQNHTMLPLAARLFKWGLTASGSPAEQTGKVKG